MPNIRKIAPVVAVGSAAVMAAGMLAGPAQAAPSAFTYEDSSYILTLRSGGIEYYDEIPRVLVQQQGFSYVDLIHDIGQEKGRCETWGAGYWLGQEVEEGVLGAGAAPPDAGDVSGGYRNPTTSRDVQPNLSAGDNQSARNPGIKNYFPPGNEVVDIPASGAGVKWLAKCDSDAKGSGTGDQHNIGGFQVIGSTAAGEVDKATGVYTGSSRAYVLGLEGAAGFDSMSSFMQVVNKPNEKPTITYRMSYFNSGANADKNGFTFGGQNIPADQFATAFNNGAKSFAEAGKAIGPMGASTLQPQVGVSTDGGRYSISISSAQGNLGFAVREGGLGQNQGARFGSITFEGVYGNA